MAIFYFCVIFNFVLCFSNCQANINNNNGSAITRNLIPTEAPQNLTLIHIEDMDAVIKWDPVNPNSVRGTFRGYTVRVWNSALSQVYAIPPEVTKTAVQFFPYSRNFITVSARNDKYLGPRSVAISFQAPQTEPNMPFLFDYNQLGSHSVLLQWSKPTHANGILLGYNIYCSETQGLTINDKTTVTYFVQGPENLQAKLTGLKEEIKYKVAIGAVNCAGESERNTVDIVVESHTPYPPAMPSFRYKINYNDTDPKDYFSTECSKPIYPYFFEQKIQFDKFDDDFYLLNDTAGKIVTPSSEPQEINTVNAKDPCIVKTLIRWIPDLARNPGEHFYVKYRIKGEQNYEKTPPELEEDFLILENFNGCRSYEIILVSVDGDFETESEMQETPDVLYMFRQ